MSLYTELSANVVSFCRILRGNGLPIGPAEEVDALRSLSIIRIGDPDEFRLALRTILARSRKEQDFFDRAFAKYWLGNMESSKPDAQEVMELARKKPPRKQKSNSLLNWGPGQEAQEETSAAGYSPAEVLTKKDFGKFSEHEFDEAIKIIREIARLLSTRLSRRYRKSQHHRSIDFRRTLHLSLRNAGEIMDLAFRERSMRRVKLVLLCDVSGSMENYSRFLITFLYAIQQVYGNIETFAFSTSLHRLTGILKQKDIADVLKDVSSSVPDWSGGTQIGNCLHAFLQEYGSTLLNKDTVVIILSDGWDIGEVPLMEQSMKQIHQKTQRVIWLNPLLGNPDYEPDCMGMQTALPFVDEFLPAHNLESLRELCNHLSSVRKRKGLRWIH